LDATTSADHIMMRVDTSTTNSGSIATFGSQTINGKTGPFSLASFQTMTLIANNGNWVCREPLTPAGIAANGCIVDSVYGNDVIASRNGLAFKTITAALTASKSGDTVTIKAGTYAESFTIPSGVRVAGSGAQITLLNVTSDTDLVTMGTSSSISSCILTLTGSASSNVKLRTLVFPSTTVATANCQFSTITAMSNFVGGSSSIPTYAVHSFGTGNSGTTPTTPTLLGCRIIAASASNGEVRAILSDTADNSILVSLTNVSASTTGSGKAIALETNSSGSIVQCNVCVLKGGTADISQTQGTIILSGGTFLSTPSSNGLTFTSGQAIPPMVFSAPSLTGTSTQYLRSSGGATSTTILNVKLGTRAIVHKMYVTATAGPTGGSDVFTVFKNGSATVLTATLTAGSTSATDLLEAVIFNPGDSIAVQCVASLLPCSNPTVSLTFS